MLLLYRYIDIHHKILPTVFTFHYASTLSDNNCNRCKEKYIYIPLCFYFILRRIAAKDIDTCIYIPLCFYFIGGKQESASKNTQFTFHYASTLSKPKRIVERSKKNLHSIMLLLYQVNNIQVSSGLSIYIPLCFYFIQPSSLLSSTQVIIYIPLCFYFIQT